jgi:hypothetical protein
MNLINIIQEEANKYKLDIENIKSIFTKLGEGGFGKVYEKNGFAYKVTEDESEYYFSKKIKAKQELVSTFPIIYETYENPINIKKEIKYYIIVREIINPVELHPTLKARFSNWVYKIQEYINKGNKEILEQIVQNSKLPEEYINFIIKLKEDNFILNKKYNGIDFHSGNIGRNSKGDLVLFDF